MDLFAGIKTLKKVEASAPAPTARRGNPPAIAPPPAAPPGGKPGGLNRPLERPLLSVRSLLLVSWLASSRNSSYQASVVYSFLLLPLQTVEITWP